MNLPEQLLQLLSPHLPVQTGVYVGEAPEQYLILTPVADTFALHADNLPQDEVQEVRISLFSKENYLPIKHRLEQLLLAAEITITDRRYLGHEDSTGYFHYVIDVAKEFDLRRNDHGDHWS